MEERSVCGDFALVLAAELAMHVHYADLLVVGLGQLRPKMVIM